MKSLKTGKRFSYKDLLYKSLIFIATVSVIVYFLPNEGKFNYQFDINKPWKYGLLQASFDFPIYKNDMQVQKEQDSILATYQPYFHIEKNAEKEMIERLREDYNKTLRHSLPGTDYIRYIERMLKEMYRNGIIAGNDLTRMEEDSITAIRTVEQNTATSRPVGPVLDWYELENDPDLNGDGTIVTIDQQDARGDFKTIGMPFTMSNFVPDYQRAPKLGEHNREILHALGYDDDQIASLRDSGVIGGNDGVQADLK